MSQLMKEEDAALQHHQDDVHRKKPMLFTHEEDQFLKTGVKKHDFGKWKCILGDPKLGFQEGRMADSLKKRSLAKFNK